MEKALENNNPINDDEDSDITLVLHRSFNVKMFAVQLGECGMLNFKADTISELKDFESKLLFFDPNF